ncbi:MAG: tetratricopeptide repeat protein [Casimicrobiaceae bacterium]
MFAGGWTLDAAEYVGEDPAIAREDVLDLLTSLIHKSLVMPDDRGERYRMLETLRDYARDRLRERGETAAASTRHRDYFLAFAERAEPYLEGGPEQPEWMASLDHEHDNLRSALAWNIEAPDGSDAGLRICGSIYRFWAHRGHAREGCRWCNVALADAAGTSGMAARAKALHAAGTLTWRLGDIVAARALLEQALALSRQLEDLQRESRILSNLGGVAIHQADSVAARTYLEQAVALHRTLGNETLEARVLNNLVALAINENRLAEAKVLLERALQLSRALGNRMEEATAMSHLGYIVRQSGDLEGAQTLHEHALTIAREFGIREFELEEVRHLGEIALTRGNLKAAQRHFHDALATSKEIGNLHEIALCLEAMAALAAKTGAHRQAGILLGAADAIREGIVTPRAHSEREQYEATLAACHDAQGQDVALAAIASGRALTPDAAVAHAFVWLEKR